MRGLVLVASVLAAVAGNNARAAVILDDCLSELVAPAEVHVPAIRVGTAMLAAELQLTPMGPTSESAIWLRLQTLQTATVSECTYPAPVFINGARFMVRLPVVKLAGQRVWADLEFVPTSDGQTWFKVSEFGLLSRQVFVTSVEGSGDLGSWTDAGAQLGIAAGDAICQARAQAAGLAGTFIAWLSDDTDDAYCRAHGMAGKKAASCGQAALPASAGPWVRTDGYPFAATIEPLLEDGVVYAPLQVDEFAAARGAFYRTGTWTDGTGDTSAFSFMPPIPCSNWTSAAPEPVIGGADGYTSFAWSSIASNSCDGQAALVCMQPGSGAALPNFARPGKQAFLTSVTGPGDLGSWADADGQTGIAAGDAICRTRAAGAGLNNPQRFKAWLSDSATAAVQRLTSDGPWFRLDGALVAENEADLTDGEPFTTINFTETGAYIGHYNRAWTGTDRNGSAQADTCSDWSTSLSSVDGGSGRAYDLSGWTSGRSDCGQQLHLYCLED